MSAVEVTTAGSLPWYRLVCWWDRCCPVEWEDEGGLWHACHCDRRGGWRRHLHHCSCGSNPYPDDPVGQAEAILAGRPPNGGALVLVPRWRFGLVPRRIFGYTYDERGRIAFPGDERWGQGWWWLGRKWLWEDET